MNGTEKSPSDNINLSANSKAGTERKISDNNLPVENSSSKNLSSNQIDKKQIVDNNKLKEQYKRNIKNKSYSRSIDTNIQKFKYINAVAASAIAVKDGTASNHNAQVAQPTETLSNRVKINKNKK
jgi:hypothetical protein